MQPTAAPVSYAPKLTRLAKTVAIALLQTTNGWAKPERPKPWCKEVVIALTPELAALGDVEFKLQVAAPAGEQFAAQIKATGQVPQRFDEPPVLLAPGETMVETRVLRFGEACVRTMVVRRGDELVMKAVVAVDGWVAPAATGG